MRAWRRGHHRHNIQNLDVIHTAVMLDHRKPLSSVLGGWSEEAPVPACREGRGMQDTWAYKRPPSPTVNRQGSKSQVEINSPKYANRRSGLQAGLHLRRRAISAEK